MFGRSVPQSSNLAVYWADTWRLRQSTPLDEAEQGGIVVENMAEEP